MELFKKYDLNNDGEIDQSEMDKIVEKMNESGNTTMAKDMRERFDSMLANFDANGDGMISLTEFSEAIKSLRVNQIYLSFYDLDLNPDLR